MEPITIAIIGGALLAAAAASGKSKGKASSKPTWPLVNAYTPRVPETGGRAFKASRPFSDVCNSDREHGGIDLSGNEGDRLVAMEDGVIVATQGWDGPMAKAILLQTDRGPVLLYGAVAPNSWKKFDVQVGTRVTQGQTIATLGVYPGGSTMLHFELYKKGTTKNSVWCEGKPQPENLLDPTEYLKSAIPESKSKA